MRNSRIVRRFSLRNDDESEGAEISIESERGHIIEERGYNYKAPEP